MVLGVSKVFFRGAVGGVDNSLTSHTVCIQITGSSFAVDSSLLKKRSLESGQQKDGDAAKQQKRKKKAKLLSDGRRGNDSKKSKKHKKHFVAQR